MDKELKETVKSLAKNVKAMQAMISILKCEVIRGDNGNSPAGLQWSDLAPGIPLAAKRKTTKSEGDNFEPITDDKAEEEDDENGKLETQQNFYKLLDEAGAFIETVFVSKLNTTRKVHATKIGLPQSCWLRCPKLNLVVSSTVPPGTRHVDHATSHLQQFWLDAVNLLVYVLESAEEIKLPSKAIGAIQASLQLMGNANFHNSTARRNAVLTQLNPQLKQILGDHDYKDVPPCCLGKTSALWPRS